MKLSTGSRRFLGFCVLFLFLLITLAPIAAVTAGPGNTPDPIPDVPPDGGSPGGTGTGALLALGGVITDVLAALVL